MHILKSSALRQSRRKASTLPKERSLFTSPIVVVRMIEKVAVPLNRTFGADYLASLSREFYMFLDVEGSPSLSQDYYTGWAQTLAAHSASASGGKVTILPCVYATQGDNATWSALAAAVAGGVPCKGGWIARYPRSGCQPLPDWSDTVVTPSAGIPCPILIWQYADDCHGGSGFDCSETNPSIDLQDLLTHLILPPDMAGITT